MFKVKIYKIYKEKQEVKRKLNKKLKRPLRKV